MKNRRKAKILVVDDEENIRKSLKMILEYEGYSFLEAADGEEALDIIEETVGLDLILLDVKLPGRDGLEVLAEMKDKPYKPEIIMISGHGTIKTAVDATKLGAFDFLEKPLHRERVLLCIRNALNQSDLMRECQDLRKKADKRYELIGNHASMKKLWKEILKTSPTNATVLIHGESGTGKELIARAIHNHSLRTQEMFVQVNCAAIPEELIESELFGHEKGAFTGATDKKPGKFEQADRGTIFLDEIGDMSLKTQSKVLRVLEEGEVQKVGSSKINKVDVRVIAATNKDLAKEKKEGAFREDLYFRLNVIPLYSPSLREKKEDIPLLIEYFSKFYAEENNFKVKKFSEDAVGAMIKYPWKGNVRELKNVVERLIIMTEADIIEKQDLPKRIRGGS
jgi:two-component system nitrogen regulation response regulator NtrX